MSNLLNNTIDLQEILEILDTKASGGNEPNLQDKTVTPTTFTQTVKADNGFDGLDTVTVNAMPTATQATPTIVVNSNGLITASTTQSAGYVSAGTKSITKQLTTQAAKTITPTTTSQTAVASGRYTTGTITVAAIPSSYVIPSGTVTITKNGTHNVKNYESAVVEIESSSGGEDGYDDIDSLITGTMSEYTNSRVSSIKQGIFAYASNLKSVNFPNTTSIGDSAFYSCASLTTANFSACTSIGFAAFQNCYKLTTVSFPACTTISNSAFGYCKSLTTANFPACTSIYSYAFYNCDKLTTISFPVCTKIGSWAFDNCYKLKSLYLTGSSLCALHASNAFSSTPIGGYSASAGTYGSIYVPTSLLTAYQTATNWTYFSSRFVGYDEDSGNTNLITFTFEKNYFQAEEGMTWSEWCNSKYNTGNAYIQNNSVYITGFAINGVTPSSVIIANKNYTSSGAAN